MQTRAFINGRASTGDQDLLSTELEACLNNAFQAAREKRHESVTVEHLLLALLDLSDVRKILEQCSLDVSSLRRLVEEYIEEQMPPSRDTETDVQSTLGFQRVLQRAVFHVQTSGKKEVTGEHVLVAIFSEKQSQAVHLLCELGINRVDVASVIGSESREPDAEPSAQSFSVSRDEVVTGLLRGNIKMGERLERIEKKVDEIHQLLLGRNKGDD